MELILSDDFDFEIGTDCEIEFPDYVRRLDDDALEIALNSADKHLRVVAAGADPVDQKIILFTAKGKIKVFDAKSYYIPPGPAFPCQDGLKIFLENSSGRWPGPTKGFFVDSFWLLERSESALKGSKLSTPTYNHENEVK